MDHFYSLLTSGDEEITFATISLFRYLMIHVLRHQVLIANFDTVRGLITEIVEAHWFPQRISSRFGAPGIIRNKGLSRTAIHDALVFDHGDSVNFIAWFVADNAIGGPTWKSFNTRVRLRLVMLLSFLEIEGALNPVETELANTILDAYPNFVPELLELLDSDDFQLRGLSLECLQSLIGRENSRQQLCDLNAMGSDGSLFLRVKKTLESPWPNDTLQLEYYADLYTFFSVMVSESNLNSSEPDPPGRLDAVGTVDLLTAILETCSTRLWQGCKPTVSAFELLMSHEESQEHFHRNGGFNKAMDVLRQILKPVNATGNRPINHPFYINGYTSTSYPVANYKATVEYMLRMLTSSFALQASDNLQLVISTVNDVVIRVWKSATTYCGTTSFGDACQLLTTLIHHQPHTLSQLADLEITEALSLYLTDDLVMSDASIAFSVADLLRALAMNRSCLATIQSSKLIRSVFKAYTCPKSNITAILNKSLYELMRHNEGLMPQFCVLIEGVLEERTVEDPSRTFSNIVRLLVLLLSKAAFYREFQSTTQFRGVYNALACTSSRQCLDLKSPEIVSSLAKLLGAAQPLSERFAEFLTTQLTEITSSTDPSNIHRFSEATLMLKVLLKAKARISHWVSPETLEKLVLHIGNASLQSLRARVTLETELTLVQIESLKEFGSMASKFVTTIAFLKPPASHRIRYRESILGFLNRHFMNFYKLSSDTAVSSEYSNLALNMVKDTLSGLKTMEEPDTSFVSMLEGNNRSGTEFKLLLEMFCQSSLGFKSLLQLLKETETYLMTLEADSEPEIAKNGRVTRSQAKLAKPESKSDVGSARDEHRGIVKQVHFAAGELIAVIAEWKGGSFKKSCILELTRSWRNTRGVSLSSFVWFAAIEIPEPATIPHLEALLSFGFSLVEIETAVASIGSDKTVEEYVYTMTKNQPQSSSLDDIFTDIDNTVAAKPEDLWKELVGSINSLSTNTNTSSALFAKDCGRRLGKILSNIEVDLVIPTLLSHICDKSSDLATVYCFEGLLENPEIAASIYPTLSLRISEDPLFLVTIRKATTIIHSQGSLRYSVFTTDVVKSVMESSVSYLSNKEYCNDSLQLLYWLFADPVCSRIFVESGHTRALATVHDFTPPILTDVIGRLLETRTGVRNRIVGNVKKTLGDTTCRLTDLLKACKTDYLRESDLFMTVISQICTVRVQDGHKVVCLSRDVVVQEQENSSEEIEFLKRTLQDLLEAHLSSSNIRKSLCRFFQNSPKLVSVLVEPLGDSTYVHRVLHTVVPQNTGIRSSALAVECLRVLACALYDTATTIAVLEEFHKAVGRSQSNPQLLCVHLHLLTSLLECGPKKLQWETAKAVRCMGFFDTLEDLLTDCNPIVVEATLGCLQSILKLDSKCSFAAEYAIPANPNTTIREPHDFPRSLVDSLGSLIRELAPSDHYDELQQLAQDNVSRDDILDMEDSDWVAFGGRGLASNGSQDIPMLGRSGIHRMLQRMEGRRNLVLRRPPAIDYMPDRFHVDIQSRLVESIPVSNDSGQEALPEIAPLRQPNDEFEGGVLVQVEIEEDSEVEEDSEMEEGSEMDEDVEDESDEELLLEELQAEQQRIVEQEDEEIQEALANAQEENAVMEVDPLPQGDHASQEMEVDQAAAPGVAPVALQEVPVALQEVPVVSNDEAAQAQAYAYGQLGFGDIDPETLAELPDDIRAEIMGGMQQAQQAQLNDAQRGGVDEFSVLLATMSDDLRDDMLLSVGEEQLLTLPPQYLAEATLIRHRRQRARRNDNVDDIDSDDGMNENNAALLAEIQGLVHARVPAVHKPVEYREGNSPLNESAIDKVFALLNSETTLLIDYIISIIQSLCVYTSTRDGVFRRLLAAVSDVTSSESAPHIVLKHVAEVFSGVARQHAEAFKPFITPHLATSVFPVFDRPSVHSNYAILQEFANTVSALLADIEPPSIQPSHLKSLASILSDSECPERILDISKKIVTALAKVPQNRASLDLEFQKILEAIIPAVQKEIFLSASAVPQKRNRWLTLYRTISLISSLGETTKSSTLDSLWETLGQYLPSPDTSRDTHFFLPLVLAYFLSAGPVTDWSQNSALDAFCVKHSRYLNDVVAHRPALLDGPCALLLHHPLKILNFANKKKYFMSKLIPQRHSRRHKFEVLLRRDQIFADSFFQLRSLTLDELKDPITVRFAGEEGIDVGGVTREWYLELSREIFNANYALFVEAAEGAVFQPNRASFINPDHLEYFRFVGRLIGKAVFDGYLLDAYFTRSFYKHMLGIAPGMSDIESIDPAYYKSLKWTLENPIEGVLDLTFSAEVEEFGVTRIVELKENGSNIVVTDENKEEYVELITDLRMTKAIAEQTKAFMLGFRELIPLDLVSILNEQELELLICGLPDVNITELKQHTEYRGYQQTSQVVTWFWEVVSSMDNSQRAQLLQFVTGTSVCHTRHDICTNIFLESPS